MPVATNARETLDGFNTRSRAFFSALVAPWVEKVGPFARESWWIRNQANIISTARLPIALAIVAWWVYPAYSQREMGSLYLSLLVMAVVFLSDGVDGALARDVTWYDQAGTKHDCTSKYGKAVDPMADKFTAGAMVVALIYGVSPSVPQELMTVLYVELVPIVTIELCLIGISIWTNQVCVRSGTQEPVGANMFGKAKFFIMAVALLIGLALPWPVAGVATVIALFGLALPLAYLSLIGHKRDLDAIKLKIAAAPAL